MSLPGAYSAYSLTWLSAYTDTRCGSFLKSASKYRYR